MTTPAHQQIPLRGSQGLPSHTTQRFFPSDGKKLVLITPTYGDTIIQSAWVTGYMLKGKNSAGIKNPGNKAKKTGTYLIRLVWYLGGKQTVKSMQNSHMYSARDALEMYTRVHMHTSIHRGGSRLGKGVCFGYDGWKSPSGVQGKSPSRMFGG